MVDLAEAHSSCSSSKSSNATQQEMILPVWSGVLLPERQAEVAACGPCFCCFFYLPLKSDYDGFVLVVLFLRLWIKMRRKRVRGQRVNPAAAAAGVPGRERMRVCVCRENVCM